MPYLRLSEAERQELHRRTRTPGLKPRTRNRLEMVRLADAGWTAPQIAQHLHSSASRVRHWLRRYLEAGFDALPDQPHPGRPGRLTPERLAALRELLACEDRTWTLPQLAAWLAQEHGVTLSADHLGILLRRAKLSCRRTENRNRHEQDPAQVAERRADLETAEKGATPAAWTSGTSTKPASP